MRAKKSDFEDGYFAGYIVGFNKGHKSGFKDGMNALKKYQEK